jgi:hypothetical protein
MYFLQPDDGFAEQTETCSNLVVIDSVSVFLMLCSRHKLESHIKVFWNVSCIPKFCMVSLDLKMEAIRSPKFRLILTSRHNVTCTKLENTKK